MLTERAPIFKLGLSSDCRLQLACMKSESLVIAGQNTAVNTFPGLVHTARHTMEVGRTRSHPPSGCKPGRRVTLREGQTRKAVPKAGLATRVKS